MDDDVMRLVHDVAREAIEDGAVAVVLTGSRARGDAHAESDVDIVVLGDGPEYQLHRRDGLLVTVTWQTPEETREQFADPGEVGGVVPGWRDARLVHDPTHVAAEIQREAREWTWARVADAQREWVADEMTGLAEEVHKLVVARERGRAWTAAVQRNLLALRMAGIMAVHRSVLYRSENVLWDRVGEIMGERWRRAQSRAFGEAGEPFGETCQAALDLFSLAATEIAADLDARQYAVVAHACKIAGVPLPEGVRCP